MKVLTMKELEKNSIKELVKRRNEFKKAIFELKLKNSMRALQQTHLISTAKKNVARINTVLARKQAA